MIGNLICWIFAFGLVLSESVDRTDMFIKLAFAMGFIFLGSFCKLVDVYREVNKKESTNNDPNDRTHSA